MGELTLKEILDKQTLEMREEFALRDKVLGSVSQTYVNSKSQRLFLAKQQRAAMQYARSEKKKPHA